MNKNCEISDWKVRLKAKRKKPRFKPGADLTDKVNMQIDIDENADEFSESAFIKMKVQTEDKQHFELAISKKKKPKFKHGADLTEKVNLLVVDWEEEVSDEEGSLSVEVHLTSKIYPIVPEETP